MQPIEKAWLRGVDLNHRPLGYEPKGLVRCMPFNKTVPGEKLGSETGSISACHAESADRCDAWPNGKSIT